MVGGETVTMMISVTLNNENSNEKYDSNKL